MSAFSSPRFWFDLSPFFKNTMRISTFGRSGLVFPFFLLALATTGCKKAEAVAEAKPVAPVHVETTEVVAVQAPRVLRVTGTLRGAKETDLAANVAGRITRTDVERGAEVKQGAILAQVDVRAAALSLAEARVAVETSKTQQQINQADCERYEQLKARDAVTALEYDQVTARCKTAPLNLQAAEARQSIAAKNVGDGVIRAPFSGVVTERYVEEGEYVQSSSRVVSLAQVEELRLVFSVPEANVSDVKKGADVSFHVVAFGAQTFHGEVVYIAGAVRDTRDLVVEALVKNADKTLLPGMFADIELNIGSQTVPAVPTAAVFDENGKRNVFVLAEGHLVQRVLAPLPEFQGRVPALKGVNLGERVVSTYSPTLSNGQSAN